MRAHLRVALFGLCAVIGIACGGDPAPAPAGEARPGAPARPAPASPPAVASPTTAAGGCSRSVLEAAVGRIAPLAPLPAMEGHLAPLARIPRPGPITGLAVSDDARRVLIVGPDRVHVWRPEPAPGEPGRVVVPSPEDANWCASRFPTIRDELAGPGGLSMLHASAEMDAGAAIAVVAGHDGVLRIYDLAATDADAPVRTVVERNHDLARIVWGGQMTVTAGRDGIVARDVVADSVRWRLDPPSAWDRPPLALAISPLAEWVAVVDPDGGLWRAKAGEGLARVEGELEVVRSVSIDAEGQVQEASSGTIAADGHLALHIGEGSPRVVATAPGGEWVELLTAGPARRGAIARKGRAVALEVGDEIAVYRLSADPVAP